MLTESSDLTPSPVAREQKYSVDCDVSSAEAPGPWRASLRISPARDVGNPGMKGGWCARSRSKSQVPSEAVTTAQPAPGEGPTCELLDAVISPARGALAGSQQRLALCWIKRLRPEGPWPIGLLAAGHARRGIAPPSNGPLSGCWAWFSSVAQRSGPLAWPPAGPRQENREMADQNRIRLLPPPPECGRLLDRQTAEVLATNPPQLQPLPPTRGWFTEERWLIACAIGCRPCWMCPSGELGAESGATPVAATLSNSAGRTTQQRPGAAFQGQGTAFDASKHRTSTTCVPNPRDGTLASHRLGYTSSITRRNTPPGPRGLPGPGPHRPQRLERFRVPTCVVGGAVSQLEVNGQGGAKAGAGDKQARSGKDLNLTPGIWN